MKNFLLFLTLILTADLAFPQGDAPLIIKNQGNNTKTAAPSMYVPNATSTKVTGGVLLETGNKNVLVNPAFEHSTAAFGWTTTGTVHASTTGTKFGVRGHSITTTAGSATIYQDSVINASSLYNVQGRASIWAYNANTSLAYQMCPRLATVASSKCITIPANMTGWQEFKVDFLMDINSNGLQVSSIGSGTGVIYLDDAYVGPIAYSETSAIGPWIDYGTQTITAVTTAPTKGTTSIDKVECRDVAQEIECRYRFSQTVAGSAGSGDYIFALPSGKEFDINYHAVNTTAGNLANQAPPGNNSYIQTTGVISNYTGSTGFGEVYAFAYSSTQFRLNTQAWYSNALNMSNTQYQLSNASLHWNFIIRFRAKGNSGNFSNYSAYCSSDNACSNTFTAKVSATGVVSDESSDWISGNCSVATSTFTCTLNSAISTVPMTCTASVFDTGATNGTTSYFTSITSSGFVYKTVQDGTANIAKPANIICHKQGADYVARRAIVGTFQDVNTTPGSGNPKICSFNFSQTSTIGSVCTTSPCVVSEHDGACVSTVTRTAAGTYSANWNAGYWTTVPKCVPSSINDSASAGAGGNYLRALSSTSAGIMKNFTTNTGAGVDAAMTVICHGK